MLTTQIVRYCSTRSIVDKWFNALQSRTHEEQQSKLVQCIEYSLQQDHSNYSNLITNIVHRWAIEQPTTEALWTYDDDSNECEKLTFNDIYTQASHFANVLTGNQFNLTAGKSVLVILPCAAKERILIQLACLQSGLIFCAYDPKCFTEQKIQQQIRTSAIDCILTNMDHLEMIMNCTYNSLRPLKKGLVSHHLASGPLPVGWHHLLHNINSTDTKDIKTASVQSTKHSLRHLLSEKPINQYSQTMFSFRQMLTAYWFNMNKSPRLIWIKEDNDKISLAPWLLGSTIFYRETKDIITMFKTFEKYPIDTFCGTQNDYEMLDKQQQNNTHLKLLLSTEPIIDPMVKSRWYSSTNLYIQDKNVTISTDLNNKLDVQPLLKPFATTFNHKEFNNIYGTDQYKIQVHQPSIITFMKIKNETCRTLTETYPNTY